MRLRIFCTFLVLALCTACGHGFSGPHGTHPTKQRPATASAEEHDGPYSAKRAVTYNAGYTACSAWISAIINRGASPSPAKLDPATVHLLQTEQNFFAASNASTQIWQRGCDAALKAAGHGADIATIKSQTTTTSP
jgi:hypothetical protein